MDISGGGPLSAITVQLFADLGYEVDVIQADEYTLWPPAFRGAAARLAPQTVGASVPADTVVPIPPVVEGPPGFARDVRRVPVAVVNRRSERTRVITPRVERATR